MANPKPDGSGHWAQIRGTSVWSVSYTHLTLPTKA